MVDETKQIAPYAPVDNVIGVIRRLRERGLPDTLTLGVLQSVGIPSGNAPRTLAALRFLGLVDDEGQWTEQMGRLARTTSDQYQSVLANIVRGAYEPIFAILDPDEDGVIALHDAFRQYEPQAQRARMITLFLGLCREAGIVAGGPPERFRRTRPQRQQGPGARPRIPAPGGGTPDQNDDGEALPTSPAGTDYRLLSALVQRLPKDGSWTQAQRDRWLQAMTANVDLIVTVADEEGTG